MKTKFYVLAALLMASMANVMAEETTKIHPAEGDHFDVTLGYDDANHLFIGKDKFESAVPGNIVRVYGWNTGGGAHKLLLGYQVCEGTVLTNKAYLPGGEIRDVEWNSGHYDLCLTKDMLDAIRYGGPNCAGDGVGRDFRIYGEGITINVVDLIQPGRAGSFHEPFKTVWKGLFWVDGWTTKEINKATLAPYGDFSNVRAIRFYHEANRTNFTLNLILAWDPLTKVADQSNMTLTNEYFELELTDAMRSQLAGIESVLYVQGDKGSGDAFNLTDIVFVTYSPDDCSNCFYVY
jgi:hypothetical protein